MPNQRRFPALAEHVWVQRASSLNNRRLPGQESQQLFEVGSNVGLVNSRKAGLNKYYRAVPAKFAAFASYMNDIAETSKQKN
jgi:hypothetical protein